MVAVYIFGDVSGANFNPAVSFCLGLAKKKPWKEVAIYSVIQILAGILAGFSYGLILWEVFTLKPAQGYSWWQAGLAEMLYTCMLCFVVLHVAGDVPEYLDQVSEKKNGAANNQYFGLAIGFVLMAAIPSGGHISGGCFNPAVALGIDLSSMLLGFYWWISYVIFELLGAALAAGLFFLTDPLSALNNVGGEANIKARLVSEFVGTFFLVLTVGLNVIGKSNAPVYSIAAALMCMIFALGRVSGAHFNPAVTLAVLARGGPTPRDALYYWTVQFFAGAAGAVVYTILEHGSTFPLEVGKGFSWPHVAVAEILFTFLLCYVVLAVATTKKAKTQFFGLAIGSCVTAGGIAIGTISGGVLNPAVAFGVSLTSLFGGGNFWHCIPYMFFECLAGGFAAAIFALTRPSEYGK